MIALPHLDEPNILHSLRIRYEAGEVYTSTGPILIAINPWRPVDIYKASVMEAYKSHTSAKPHIYGVAIRAYDAMIAKRKAQCILIAGRPSPLTLTLDPRPSTSDPTRWNPESSTFNPKP